MGILSTFLHGTDPARGPPPGQPRKGGFDPAHEGGGAGEPVLISFDVNPRVHLGGGTAPAPRAPKRDATVFEDSCWQVNQGSTG